LIYKFEVSLGWITNISTQYSDIDEYKRRVEEKYK